MTRLFRHPFRMFRLLRLVWRARRPSTIDDMPAVVDTFWLRRGYEAMTFFGYIVTHSQHDADVINSRYDVLKNHEMIHLRQAQSTGDSWWRFYRLYLHYWLQGWRARRRYPDAGYRLNPFEMEAYEHMYDLHYLDHCPEGVNGWRRYAAMTVDERMACVRKTEGAGR